MRPLKKPSKAPSPPRPERGSYLWEKEVEMDASLEGLRELVAKKSNAK